MPNLENLERLFRNLHQQAYQEYEETAKQQREEHRLWLEDNRERQAQEREMLLRVSQLSEEQVVPPDRKKEASTRAYLDEVRSQAIERPSHQHRSAKKIAILGGLQAPNLKAVPLYATSIMSGETEDVEDVPGERGNPWVLPWNPGQVKISQHYQDSNYGLCGWARVARSPVIADVWFAFLPDTTAIWNLLTVFAFSGFYLLNANRGFLLCRDSRITVDVSLNAYQYFWFGEQKTSLLNEESDSGFRFGFYDETQFLNYKAFLRADPDSYAFVRVRITIKADAYGENSWSEINFKDGAANFINPILLAAAPNG